MEYHRFNFRLVAYLNLRFLYKILYMYVWYNFEIVLYLFLDTGTSDKIFMGFDHLLKFLGVSLYLIIFPLNSN